VNGDTLVLSRVGGKIDLGAFITPARGRVENGMRSKDIFLEKYPFYLYFIVYLSLSQHPDGRAGVPPEAVGGDVKNGWSNVGSPNENPLTAIG
jgi:hypothetical protein